jgi:hypothetical protein
MRSIARATVCTVVGAFSSLVHGQYVGDQIMGLAGLQSGSQPAPGIYITIPLYFRYGGIAITVRRETRS